MRDAPGLFPGPAVQRQSARWLPVCLSDSTLVFPRHVSPWTPQRGLQNGGGRVGEKVRAKGEVTLDQGRDVVRLPGPGPPPALVAAAEARATTLTAFLLGPQKP